MAYPRHQRARAHRFERYTAGTITMNSTTWANMPGFATQTIEGRLRYRTSAASNKTMYSAADAGIFFSVKNLGPADPE